MSLDSLWLCLRVTLLDPAFHGQRDEALPEWPPAPLRLFQALVAGQARREPADPFAGAEGAALRWLETLAAPQIVAPPAHEGQPIRTAVPNNDLDLVARAWARGREPDKQPNQLKTLKTVQTLQLPDGRPVFFLWPIAPERHEEARHHLPALQRLAGSLIALGWGQNLAMAEACLLDETEASALPGLRWLPGSGGEVGPLALRSPRGGCLDGLIARHDRFLRRIQGGEYDHLGDLEPELYVRVSYRRADLAPPVPFVVFDLMRPEGDKRTFFETPRWGMRVAGMVRHVLGRVARQAGRDDAWTERYVFGHESTGGQARGDDLRRFAYVPLPTVQSYDGKEKVGGIQRVMVTAPPGDEAEIAWAGRLLAGQELLYHDPVAGTTQAVAVLVPVARDDYALRRYTQPARVWHSVTPVVLPGRDDSKPAKTRRLLQRCLEHAGCPQPEAIAWQPEGFLAGTEYVKRYEHPQKVDHPVRYHVRLTFAEPITGPMVLGRGRYWGSGLLLGDLDGPEAAR
jgi:CRISPR-associated protein Csb2